MNSLLPELVCFINCAPPYGPGKGGHACLALSWAVATRSCARAKVGFEEPSLY